MAHYKKSTHFSNTPKHSIHSKLFPKSAFSIVLIFLSLFFFMVACSSDNEEDLFAGQTLETASYADNVVPILQNNCYGCHSAANSASGAGHVLEGYTELTKYENDLLLSLINQEEGFSAMPPFGKLSDNDIAIIQQWIDEGALDN